MRSHGEGAEGSIKGPDASRAAKCVRVCIQQSVLTPMPWPWAAVTVGKDMERPIEQVSKHGDNGAKEVCECGGREQADDGG